MKYKISLKIRFLAWWLGVEFRQGKSPEECSIITNGLNIDFKKHLACYFGEGVIWINTSLYEEDISFILLHEIGHAILDFFPINRDVELIEETNANAIALGLASILRIGIPSYYFNCVDSVNREIKQYKIEYKEGESETR